MSGLDDIDELAETGFDRVLGFTIAASHARGRMVRLGPVLETILSAHDYPVMVKHVLAEALVLTALMGSLLKDENSQLTVQAQAEGGALDLLVCDYRDGDLRGYVRHDADKLAGFEGEPTLEALFGTGYLCVTFDLAASGERYQGVVPLEGACLADAFEAYFSRSEQIPTLLRVAVRSTASRCIAGGMLLQHFPEGEEGGERLHVKEAELQWEHVSVLGGTLSDEELTDAALPLEDLVWRLFHDEPEVRVAPLAPLARGCRCNVEHYRSVLAQFPDGELATMRDPDGTIPVDCAFCSKVFRIDV